MSKSKTDLSEHKPVRKYPSMEVHDGKEVMAKIASVDEVANLLGMRTNEAAEGVFNSALEALGASVEGKAQMVAAMYAEVEPRDGIEAMLVAQMTTTHVAMMAVSAKLSHASIVAVRESCERSMTRLSRTYLAQMDALRKYRAKAQQVVRVERVTVNDGGQAIVGAVEHGGGA